MQYPIKEIVAISSVIESLLILRTLQAACPQSVHPCNPLADFAVSSIVIGNVKPRVGQIGCHIESVSTLNDLELQADS